MYAKNKAEEMNFWSNATTRYRWFIAQWKLDLAQGYFPCAGHTETINDEEIGQWQKQKKQKSQYVLSPY